MLKKVIPIALSLCLLFSVSVMAENEGVANDSSNPDVTQEMPMQVRERPMQVRERPMDRQQGTPPEMPNRERPQAENGKGQMPQGDFTPPQNNETMSGGAALPENNIPQSENKQDVNNAPENEAENNTQNSDVDNGENVQQDRQFPQNMQGGFPNDMRNNTQNAETKQPTGFVGFVKTYSTPITSIILLMLAFVFVFFYKRRNY